MKRFATLSILMLYTIFSCGLTVYSHYCAGKLASVSFLAPKYKGCGKCGKTTSKDCCKDTQYNLQLDESQLGSGNFIIHDYLGHIALLPSNTYEFQFEFALVNSNAVKFYIYENGPPKTPIYIQIHSLII